MAIQFEPTTPLLGQFPDPHDGMNRTSFRRSRSDFSRPCSLELRKRFMTCTDAANHRGSILYRFIPAMRPARSPWLGNASLRRPERSLGRTECLVFSLLDSCSSMHQSVDVAYFLDEAPVISVPSRTEITMLARHEENGDTTTTTTTRLRKTDIYVTLATCIMTHSTFTVRIILIRPVNKTMDPEDFVSLHART